MIPELGHFSLILALAFATLVASTPLWTSGRRTLQLQRYYVAVQCASLLFAYVCLTYSFWNNDFSVLYVANHSSRALPLIYKLFAVWGAHEGSMLLWVVILSVWTFAVSRAAKSLPKTVLSRILTILALISCGFLAFILLTSNPFLRLLPDIPAQGRDLNPLLQDPGFVIHPPMLYMGYVGFAVTFAFAIAALWSGRLDARWAQWSRPWTLLAWCFLTFGITLGSWWAYRVLGWGGWWFWDPVENASFMPWLVGTALIHSLIVTQKRDTFRAWTVLLAITTFALSLLGTFLVRSGVLTSVHAFAVDPQRGIYMLLFLVVVVSSSLLLYAWRAPRLRSGQGFALLSRESLLLFNNIFLAVAMLTVLLGTLYPLMIDALGLGKLSVGAPYFNLVFIPLMTPVLILMGLGPHTYWLRMPRRQLWQRVSLVVIAVMVMALVLLIWQVNLSFLLGLLLCAWLILATLSDIARKYRYWTANISMWLAHTGVAITALGISVLTQYSVQTDVRIAPGETASVAGYHIHWDDIRDLEGPNYRGVKAAFTIKQEDQFLDTVTAEKRLYTRQQMALASAATSVNVWRDIYIAMGEPLEGDAWSVRLYYKPMIRWIWCGGLLILFGGLAGLLFRGRRHA